MNMRVCKKLKPGAIVRKSWDTGQWGRPRTRTGIVLGKRYVEEAHQAVILGHMKSARYDVVVHWFEPDHLQKENPEVHQCWELMLVSHAK